MGHYVSLINGMSNAQADDFMSFATDLLDGNSGIVASGDYAVAQSSPVAMSVTVATGKAYIYISSLLSYYRTILDAAATLSIASNSSGSTRIDLICIKIDTGATPDANASNVASVLVVQGTPGGGAPATPANHYKLAEVTVASGAATIVTANIADSRIQLNIRTGTKVGGVTPGAATDAGITFSDVTTNDASTSKHGFLKKLSNVATQFMNGVGNWVDGVAADGWTLANETWTYASATTITVPTDLTTKYYKGMKIKLTQSTGGTKYFIIATDPTYGAPNTTLTIHPFDSTTSLANEAISTPYYSSADKPAGFPSKPKLSAYLSTAQDNIANNTSVVINIDSESYDIGGNFNTTTHLFTAPCTGYYDVKGCVGWKSGTTVDQKVFNIEIFVDSTAYATHWVANSGTLALIMPISRTIFVSKGSQIALRCYHDVGAATPDLYNALPYTFLTIDYIEP